MKVGVLLCWPAGRVAVLVVVLLTSAGMSNLVSLCHRVNTVLVKMNFLYTKLTMLGGLVDGRRHAGRTVVACVATLIA